MDNETPLTWNQAKSKCQALDGAYLMDVYFENYFEYAEALVNTFSNDSSIFPPFYVSNYILLNKLFQNFIK